MQNLKEILDNSLLLIESPGKIKIFEKYIGKISKTCTILSSYGHICNLKPEKSSVDVQNHFKMTWENTVQSKKALPAILEEAKKAKHIIIATDPDREGEAIGWHIVNYLKKQKISKPIYRVLFHALTQADIYKALESPSEMRQDLIDAYLARLSLDFLVGFNISPLLWRKLPGCSSAGRVQSTALRNIIELEYKIVQFKSQTYFHILSKFIAEQMHTKEALDSKLISFPYAKINGYCVYHTEAQVKYILQICHNAKYVISDIYKTERNKHSPAPFITSTLQQDASSKLKLSPKQTMQIAQKLYEGVRINGELLGLITYMRTDNVKMSETALENCRDYISKHHSSLLSPKIKQYKNNAKNTQEAHECIRPTDFNLTPEQIKNDVTYDMYALYSLIWKRAVASQMKDATYEDNIVEISSDMFSTSELSKVAEILKTSIDIKEENQEHDESDNKKNKQIADNNAIVFQTKHTVLTFAGWLSIYNVDTLAEQAHTHDATLGIQQNMSLLNIEYEAKHTTPPARYTAASLIARMEKLGIGRPGTYTNMIDILITREYINKIDGYLKPTQKSWFLIAFLEQFFTNYIQYDFTADMEEKLDQIAQGQLNWLNTMQNFWQKFEVEVEQAAKSKYEDMQPFIANLWHNYFFKSTDTCQKCQSKAVVRFWKGNGFLACSNYPACDWTSSIEATQTQSLGIDPVTAQKISIFTDQYNNTYLQWASNDKNPSSAVKIPINLKDEFSPENFTIDKALKLKSMPLLLGKHPDTDNDILLGIGKFGPYIKYDGKFTSIKSNPLTFTLQDAIKLLAKPVRVKRAAKSTDVQTSLETVKKKTTTVRAKTVSRAKKEM